MSGVAASDRTAALARLVSRTRAGLVATALAAGLLLVVAAAVAWVVGGVLLDLATPLPVAGRVAVFAGWWLAVAAAAAAFLFVPALRRPSLDTAAILIERAVGGMHNRLLTVVDLAHGRTRDGRAARDAKPAMVERLVAQTTARLEGYRATRVITGRAVARNLGLAALAAVLLGGLGAIFGERFSITFARLLSPTADIPPATWLQLAAPGPLEVLEGESLDIACAVTRGEADAVSVVLTPAAGAPSRYPLRPITSGTFTVTLDGLDHEATYRLVAGNTWTKTFPLTILRRPVVEDVTALVRLPAYMRIDETIPVDPEASGIEAPHGAAVEFRATVSGDVGEGGARLLQRSIEQRTVETVDERVWFEDDLPRDAVAATPWRWTTAAAAGGLRAFAVDHGDDAVAMKTRLEPMLLPKEGLESKALCVHAKVDPADPPHALAMTLDAGGPRLEVLWGDPAALPPAAGLKRLVAGPLPATSDWTRLDVPLAGAAAELAGRSVGGVAFRVDRGRVVLDRPGWLARRSETVEEPVDTPVGDVAATRERDGTWLTSVTVDAPRFAALEFRSSRGHASLPRPAFELVPTVDRPPSLVVHEPRQMPVLEAAVDIAVVAEVFDDWGLDEIGFRSGPDAEHLGPRTPLAGVAFADRPPDVRRDVRASVRGEALGLTAGRTTAWRLYVRDTKGQITDGPLWTNAVARPPEHALADAHVPAARQAVQEAKAAAEQAAKRKAALEQQRRQVIEAVGKEPLARIKEAEAAAKAAAEAEKQAQQADNDTKPAAEKARDEARSHAAEKVQQAQQSVEQAVQALPEQPKAALAAADAALEAQRAEAQRLADAAAKAAEQARSSPLVPKPQADALQALAERANDLERGLAKDERFAGETAKVDRAADAPKSDDVARETEAIGVAIEEVAKAIDAAGTAQRLEALAEDLGERAEALEALAAEAESPMPAEPALPEPAPGDSAAGDSAHAEPPVGEPAVGESAVGEPAVGEPAPAEVPLAEVPAGAGDPPSASDPAAELSPAEQAAQQQLAELDRILGTEPGSEPAGGDRGSGGPAKGEPLADAAAKARTAEAEAIRLAEEVSRQADAVAADPVQAALAMAERARALEAMRVAAEAAAAKQAALAAAANQPAPRGSPGDEPVQPGKEPARGPGQRSGTREPGPGGFGPAASSPPDTAPEEIADADRRGLDPALRAAIEKLPPHVRDPLLEGMRQRGPEAYRGVTEAYFRRLGEEIPR